MRSDRKRRPRARHRWRYARNGSCARDRGSRRASAASSAGRSRALTSTTVVRFEALLGDRNRWRDLESARRARGGARPPAAAAARALVERGFDRLHQPTALAAVVDRPGRGLEHEEIVERHAVARGVDARVDDVAARRGDAPRRCGRTGPRGRRRKTLTEVAPRSASTSAIDARLGSPMRASASATCRALAACHASGSASQ